MIIHELNEADCLEVLSRVHLGRLACEHDGQPDVVPISFYFDGTAALYTFSTVGQKIQWMRKNPKVCVETDDIADRLHWTTVIITGTYEELSGAGHEEELRRAYEFLRQRSQWWLPATGRLPNRDDHAEVVIFRIRIGSVSGRRAH
jgi:nitroimidazol reductase NimA-like FMN-containing flavoprotein (pyridoxamine 5'-phosphate oxidase superfamily)